MGILDGLVKGFAMAATAGMGTNYLLLHVLSKNGKEVSPLLSTIATGCAAIAGFLYYSRVWIQGCWIDRSYNTANENLQGRCVVVTGGTVGGIGFAAAQLLAQLGATVIVTCRTTAKGQAAVQKLKSSTGNQNIYYVIMDFLSNQSVRNGAREIAQKTAQIDCLILNAGISQGPHAQIWQTNHIGPFLLVQELLPLLSNSNSPRVVSVSSGAHKNAQIHWADPFSIPQDQRKLFGGAYGQSKLANIMHMRELARKECYIKCFAVTPGAVATNMVGDALLQPLLGIWLRSPTTGAQVIQMACLDPNIPSGSYLSNCRVKETEGFEGCSNDPGQAKKLWELSERQIRENRFP